MDQTITRSQNVIKKNAHMTILKKTTRQNVIQLHRRSSAWQELAANCCCCNQCLQGAKKKAHNAKPVELMYR